MGREIRRVPPNWKHPTARNRYTGEEHDKPMYDQRYEDAAAEWLADFDRIRNGGMTDDERGCYPRGAVEWAHDNTAPNPEMYRPWTDEEATWFQVWQTVSEGSPVTPPFETKAELVEYLVANGDFWDQKRGREAHGDRARPGWDREAAERFVDNEWAPSMIVSAGRVILPGDAE